MNVVDSSAWLAYFSGARNARWFAPAIENLDELLVPSITIAEVFKVIARERGPDTATVYVAHMQQGRVIDLDDVLAIDAAEAGLAYGLPLADSIIYATAQYFRAVVWTQDADFEGLPGVRYRAA